MMMYLLMSDTLTFFSSSSRSLLSSTHFTASSRVRKISVALKQMHGSLILNFYVTNGLSHSYQCYPYVINQKILCHPTFNQKVFFSSFPSSMIFLYTYSIAQMKGYILLPLICGYTVFILAKTRMPGLYGLIS